MSHSGPLQQRLHLKKTGWRSPLWEPEEGEFQILLILWILFHLITILMVIKNKVETCLFDKSSIMTLVKCWKQIDNVIYINETFLKSKYFYRLLKNGNWKRCWHQCPHFLYKRKGFLVFSVIKFSVWFTPQFLISVCLEVMTAWLHFGIWMGNE